MLLSKIVLFVTTDGWFGGRLNLQMFALCSIYPWAIMCDWGYGFEATGLFSLAVGFIAMAEVVTICRFQDKSINRSYLFGWGMFLCGYILVAIVATTYIRWTTQSGWYLLWLTVVIIATDVGAITVGKLANKFFTNKPISEKWLGLGKTWQGSIGGIVIGATTGLLTGVIFDYFWNVNPATLDIRIVLCPMAAIFGDILESFFKRRLGWKDSSRLLGGHGGFLDRFDSYFTTMIFSALYLGWL